MKLGHLQQVFFDGPVNWFGQVGRPIHKGKEFAEMRMGQHPEALHFLVAAGVLKSSNYQSPKNLERHHALIERLQQLPFAGTSLLQYRNPFVELVYINSTKELKNLGRNRLKIVACSLNSGCGQFFDDLQ
jgi:hypothetical protein